MCVLGVGWECRVHACVLVGVEDGGSRVGGGLDERRALAVIPSLQIEIVISGWDLIEPNEVSEVRHAEQSHGYGVHHEGKVKSNELLSHEGVMLGVQKTELLSNDYSPMFP